MAESRRAARAAPFWRRVLADLFDVALLAAIGWGLWILGPIQPSVIPPLPFDWIDSAADLLAEHSGVFRRGLTLMPAVALVYAIGSRGLLGGTLGERLLRLRLVDHDGYDAGPFRALAHGLGTGVGLSLATVGYMWAAVSSNRQGLAEAISGTVLVHGEVIIRPRATDTTR